MTEFYERGVNPGPVSWEAFVASVRATVRGGARWLSISGSMPPHIAPEDAALLVHAGHEADALVAVDQHDATLAAALAAGPDLVKVNQHEARDLTGHDDPATAAAALRDRAIAGGADAAHAIAVVTLGADGALMLTPDGRTIHGDLDVVAPYPTGSGDSFLAGLLVGQRRGLRLARRAGRRARRRDRQRRGRGRRDLRRRPRPRAGRTRARAGHRQRMSATERPRTLRPMNRAERLGAILQALSERGNVDVEDLTRDLDVSPATVRRDLQALHEQRLLERTHGGAVAIGGLYELPMRYRSSRQREEKLRIARGRDGPRPRRHVDRPDRRDHDDRDRPRARRATRS